MVDNAAKKAVETVTASFNGKAVVMHLASMAVATTAAIVATAIVIKQIEKRED